MAAPEADRLAAVATALCQQKGVALLGDPDRLSALLAERLPEQQTLIRGMVAALGGQVPAHVRAARDPEVARQLAAARLAAEQGLTQAQAEDALDVAMRVSGPSEMGPAGAQHYGTPVQSEWVGLSAPVAAPVLKSVAPAGIGAAASGKAADLIQTFVKRKWLIGAVAAVAVVVLVQSGQSTHPGAPGQPATPAPLPGQEAMRELPVLTVDLQKLPPVEVRNTQGGIELDFAVPVPNSMLVGTVVLKAQNWQNGVIGFAHQGASEAESLSAVGPFVLAHNQTSTARIMKPNWTRDRANAGDICVIFAGPPGDDVKMNGSSLCLLEAVNQECGKIIGCGRVA